MSMNAADTLTNVLAALQALHRALNIHQGDIHRAGSATAFGRVIVVIVGKLLDRALAQDVVAEGVWGLRSVTEEIAEHDEGIVVMSGGQVERARKTAFCILP